MTTHSRARLAALAVGALVSIGVAAVDADAGVVRFQPVADAHVNGAKRKANFGRSKTLVVDGSPVVRSYLRFNVRGLGGAVSYATLQLSAMNSSAAGLSVRRAAKNNWGEKAIRFANAPRVLVKPTAKSRNVKSFRTANISVTKLVRGNGPVTLVVIARGRGGARFASGEGPKILRPSLVVGTNSAPTCLPLVLATSEDMAGTIDPACSDAERDRLSYQIASKASLGTASIVGGKLRYVPKADSYGSDRFVYRAKDARKRSKPVAVTVTIRPVNDAPTCSARALTVDEDSGGALAARCTDIDGDPLSYSITAGAQRGSTQVVGGELRYVPQVNTNGADSFMFRARDTTLPSAPATVFVTVRPVNDAPACAPVSLATFEDVVGEVGPACSDIDGDALAFGISSQGANGSAWADGGKLRYAPNANVSGSDSFTYFASDGAAGSAPATASVAIAPVNDAPTCFPVSISTQEDNPDGHVAPSCTDVENDPLTYSIASQGTKGAASFAGGELHFTPIANANGGDSFTYRANDGGAQEGAPATVTVTIQPINDAPVAHHQAASTPEDTTKSLTLAASDVDGDTLTFAIVSGPSHGTLSGSGASRSYTPNPNYNGPDSFTFRASDSAVDSNIATVTLTVNPVNDPPVCANIPLAMAEDVTAEGNPSCTDNDGDALSYVIVTQGGHGTASVTALKKLRYVPDGDFHGTDSFTYLATDGTNPSLVATVSVVIAAVNDAPVCFPVSIAVEEDNPDGGVAPANCTDVDSNPLTYLIGTQGMKGTASVEGSNLRYVPNPNNVGPDSFTYRANDGLASSTPAQATVTIGAVNDPPVCLPRTLSLDEDAAGSVSPLCTDPEGDALTHSIVGQGTKGTAQVVGGALLYATNADAHGNDTFTYKASDGPLTSAPATVSVTIRPVNDAPTCANVGLTTNEDIPGESAPDCADIDGDALTYSVASQGSKGTASVVTSKLRYVPNGNANGADSFTYRAGDGSDQSAAAMVAVTIAPVNDAPICGPLALATTEDAPAEMPPACTDVEGNPLTYSIVSQGAKGIASVVGGKLRYVPSINANGSDSFTYRGSDGTLTSSAATVSVAIAPVNDAPACANVSITTNEDVAGQTDPLCTDVEGDPLTYSIVGQGVKGEATVAGGKLRYVPTQDANGPDSFTYRASDSADLSPVATATVTIAPVNDEPTCAGVVLTTNEDVAGERDPSCTDVDSVGLTYSIDAQGAKGTASVIAGRLRYVPGANLNGSDSFTYQASDGTAASNSATVTVTIAAVNDAPVCADVDLTTPEDVPAERDPSCTDVDSGALTYSIVGQGTKGTATVTVGNKLRYEPNLNTNGPDSFTYKANDGTADSAAATVSVTIQAVNNPPVCSDVTLTTDEDVTAERDPSCTDADGDSLAYSIVGQGSKGTASVVAGKLRYVPNANANGPDSFTYRAADPTDQSGPATVSVTIAAVADPPVAVGQSASTAEDTAKALTLGASDGDGDPLTFTIVADPAHGSLSGTGANQTYTPAANYHGPDSFAFKVNDGTADSNVATISLTVTSVNDAPSCPAQTLTVEEDTNGSLTPVCTDPEGQAITLEIVDPPASATAEVVGGELRFVPNADANGPDTFTYRGTDGALAGAPATVSVTVNPVNDAPTCNAVTLMTQIDTPGTIAPNCADVEGDSLTVEIVTHPDHGTASVNGDQLEYNPATGYSGDDLYTYRAWDGTLFSPPANVSVTVTP